MCGHTHRPQATDLGAGYRLLVLPAWCDVPAGYRERDRSLVPMRVADDGTCKPATETFEFRPEPPHKKKGVMW